jgi:hypothetical protein
MAIKRSNNLNTNSICEYCAWSPDRKSDFQYYCYYFDEHYDFANDQYTIKGVPNSANRIYLKMQPCKEFHSKPSDMEKGAVFAKYFQNKRQIEASSMRSWISIGISILAVIVSIVLFFLKKN